MLTRKKLKPPSKLKTVAKQAVGLGILTIGLKIIGLAYLTWLLWPVS